MCTYPGHVLALTSKRLRLWRVTEQCKNGSQKTWSVSEGLMKQWKDHQIFTACLTFVLLFPLSSSHFGCRLYIFHLSRVLKLTNIILTWPNTALRLFSTLTMLARSPIFDSNSKNRFHISLQKQMLFYTSFHSSYDHNQKYN